MLRREVYETLIKVLFFLKLDTQLVSLHSTSARYKTRIKKYQRAKVFPPPAGAFYIASLIFVANMTASNLSTSDV